MADETEPKKILNRKVYICECYSRILQECDTNCIFLRTRQSVCD